MSDLTLNRLLRTLEKVNHAGPLNHHSAPRYVHLHPDDFYRLKAFAPAPADYSYGPINALLGLDILTRTGQPRGTHRITDRHGCLISDTRSGTRPLTAHR